MILTKSVKVKITKRNIDHYQKYKYQCKLGDIINVKTEHLMKGSHEKIYISCDICNKKSYVEWRDLLKVLNKHGYFTCKGKCSTKKIEKTKLEIYGATNNSKLDSWKDGIKNLWENRTEEEIENIQNKQKETCVEKYGVEYAGQSEIIKNKIKNIFLEKYGVENPSYIKEIKDKRVQTKLKNFGAINNSQTKEWKDGIKNIWENRTEEEIKKIQNKQKETCLEKYGVEYALQSKKIKNKIKESNFIKYGVESHNQDINIHIKQQKSGLKIKKFRNTDLNYQGTYELDFLEKYYDKIKITKTDTINYTLNESNHYYFPDFYLPDYNLIVEIKSEYTFNKYLEKNIAKKEGSLKLGFNFIFIIDKNYKELDLILN